MITTEIKRSNDGRLHLWTHGRPVDGAVVSSIEFIGAEHYAKVMVPLSRAILGEVDNVVPFVRPASG